MSYGLFDEVVIMYYIGVAGAYDWLVSNYRFKHLQLPLENIIYLIVNRKYRCAYIVTVSYNLGS